MMTMLERKPGRRDAAAIHAARFQAKWVPVSRPESPPTLRSGARADARPVSTFAARALLDPERKAPEERRGTFNPVARGSTPPGFTIRFAAVLDQFP
jgi:hypothetical protein